MLNAKVVVAPFTSSNQKSLSDCIVKLRLVPLLSLVEKVILPFSAPFTHAVNIPASALKA